MTAQRRETWPVHSVACACTGEGKDATSITTARVIRSWGGSLISEELRGAGCNRTVRLSERGRHKK